MEHEKCQSQSSKSMLTKSQKRRRNLRSSSRRRIGKLVRLFDGKCAWCDREILTRDKISGKVIEDRNNGKIVWVKDGLVVLSYLATVDHLKPLCEGGLNGYNLVPACVTCNLQRGVPRHKARFAAREAVWQLRERILRDRVMDCYLVI